MTAFRGSEIPVKAVSGDCTGEGVGPDGITGISILFCHFYPFYPLQTTGSTGSEGLPPRLACWIPHFANKGYMDYRPICESSWDRGKNHGRVMARGCCACSCASSCVHTLHTHSYTLGHTAPARSCTHTTHTTHTSDASTAASGVVAAGTGAPRLAGIWADQQPRLAQPYREKLCSHQMKEATPGICTYLRFIRQLTSIGLYNIVQVLYCTSGYSTNTL